MAFHAGFGKDVMAAGNRVAQEGQVRSERAQAALVYGAGDCARWCQFGAVADLPRIKHRKACAADQEPVPDWRITGVFVDKAWSGKGGGGGFGGGFEPDRVGGRRAGGIVRAGVAGRTTAAAFLHNGELAMFDRGGFALASKPCTDRWLVARQVAGAWFGALVQASSSGYS